MRVNLPVVYSQFDPQWKDKLLGLNTDPKYNFYNFGCLVTSLANICRYYGYDETPASLNDKLLAVQGFVEGGLYVHGSISKIYPDIQETVVKTPDFLTNEQIAQIKQNLDSGQPLIFGIDYNPKTLAVDYHFSTVIDYNPKEENDFTLADPLGGTTHSLKSYLGWLKPSARVTIQSYFIYSGPVRPVPEPTPQPQPEAQPEPQQPQSALPPNYAEIVHGSTQWDETVKYLELGKVPAQSFFEDAKRVIAGLKSAKTDYNNKRIEAEKKSEVLETTVVNLEKDIDRLQKELLNQEKLKKAEIDSLKQNVPNIDNYRKQIEGIINQLRGEVEAYAEEAKKLRVELAEKRVEEKAEAELAQEEASESKPTKANPLVAFLRRIFVIRW